MDFTPYDTLVFFTKNSSGAESEPGLKIELWRKDHTQVMVNLDTRLTNTWQKVEIPLENFECFGDLPCFDGWNEMSQILFTFEADYSGSRGEVYLDDIYLERCFQGAPSRGPEPTQTALPSATLLPTGSPTPTLQPSETPTPTATPISEALLVANFDAGITRNNLGGDMGRACPEDECPSPDIIQASYQLAGSHRGVLRLEYAIQHWAAFWIQLLLQDLTPYRQLQFDIRSDADYRPPNEVKIELKRQDGREVSIFYLGGITREWQTVQVNLEDFSFAGYGQPISAWTDMQELVFTVEQTHSGGGGVIYLDNIQFVP